MKRLIDEASSLWMENVLQGKLGGVFVSGDSFGGARGGAKLTMAALHANFLEHGMSVASQPRTAIGYAEGGLHLIVVAEKLFA